MLVPINGSVYCVDLHPSEPLVLAATANDGALAYDYEKKELLFQKKIQNSICNAVKWIASKGWAIISLGNHIYVFDCQGWKMLKKLRTAHTVFDMQVHSERPFVLAPRGGLAKDIFVWDWDSEFLPRQTFSAHSGQVTDISVHGDTFCSSSKDRTVRLWHLDSCEPLRTFKHTEIVNAVAYNGKQVVSGQCDGIMRVWNTESKSDMCCRVFQGHSRGIYNIRMHPSLPIAFSTSLRDTAVHVWSTETYEKVHEISYPGCDAISVCVHEDRMAVGCKDAVLVFSFTVGTRGLTTFAVDEADDRAIRAALKRRAGNGVETLFDMARFFG